jgi:hypothetical protein
VTCAGDCEGRLDWRLKRKLLEAGGARCWRRGVELLAGGGGGEAGGGGAERNRGQAGTAARLAGGMLRAENASANEP